MAKTVLVVDDERDLLSLLTVRLGSAGYNVLGVSSAEKALALVEKKKPDLILLDLLLPRMQGEEFCQRLKSDRNLKQIPVIILTASVSRVVEVISKMGADDHMLKPFETEELLSKIKRLIP